MYDVGQILQVIFVAAGILYVVSEILDFILD